MLLHPFRCRRPRLRGGTSSTSPLGHHPNLVAESELSFINSLLSIDVSSENSPPRSSTLHLQCCCHCCVQPWCDLTADRAGFQIASLIVRGYRREPWHTSSIRCGTRGVGDAWSPSHLARLPQQPWREDRQAYCNSTRSQCESLASRAMGLLRRLWVTPDACLGHATSSLRVSDSLIFLRGTSPFWIWRSSTSRSERRRVHLRCSRLAGRR